MSNNKFLKGAAVLGIAGVIVKIIGAVFRIPLTNWIGQDGMSYYGCAYPIYSLFSSRHIDSDEAVRCWGRVGLGVSCWSTMNME